MYKYVSINEKIKSFKKNIEVDSDKSLSIRSILIASQAIGVSKIANLLKSEDVINALKAIKSHFHYIKKAELDSITELLKNIYQSRFYPINKLLNF